MKTIIWSEEHLKGDLKVGKVPRDCNVTMWWRRAGVGEHIPWAVTDSENFQLQTETHTVNMETQTEEGGVTKVSVIQEIKRFQEEINKVEEENGKFYRWKMRRASKTPVFRKLTSAISTESLLSCQKRKIKVQKRVSYCDAVTVFGSSESLGLVDFLLLYYTQFWFKSI